MPRVGRSTDWESLYAELCESRYEALLTDLRRTAVPLQTYRSWPEVLTFLKGCPFQDRRRDAILLPILRAYRESRDPRWYGVLLAIFWPGLAGIHARRQDWERNAYTRWQDLLCAFLEAVAKLDPERSTERLTQRLLNDTNGLFRAECRRELQLRARECAVDDAVLVAPAPSSDPFEKQALSADEWATQLRSLAHGRGLSEADLMLVLSTRIYGKSLAHLAQEAGVPYQTLKKRRQRAEASLLVALSEKNLARIPVPWAFKNPL